MQVGNAVADHGMFTLPLVKVGTTGVYAGVANVWSRGSHTIVIERRHVPQLASLAHRPQVERPARTKTKARQKRQALAYRLFGPSTPTY
jgi:5-methylcytosine-specific restriction endonuclease McrA